MTKNEAEVLYEQLWNEHIKKVEGFYKEARKNGTLKRGLGANEDFQKQEKKKLYEEIEKIKAQVDKN